MSDRLQRQLQIICAWCGPGYIVAVFSSLIIMGFFPWPAPSASVDQISGLYHANSVHIRLGSVLMMFGAMLFLPFGALLGQHIQRFEGERTGLLTIMFIMAGYANAMLTFYPPMWWITGAFRAERSSDLIYLMNDAAWIQFFGGYLITIPMFLVPAIMILYDRSHKPVFPRWMGYFNLFTAVIIMPDQAVFFFHRGPFSWNGLIAVWIPLAFLGNWYLAMFFYMIRHALRLPTEAQTRPVPGRQ